MDLTGHLYTEMVRHALSQTPREACGLLLGRDGSVLEFRPAPNEAEEPHTRYRIPVQYLFKLEKELRERGMELVGIFHSHPATPAYPSRTDIAQAFYPDAVYLILSLADPENPVMRGFRILEGEVTEEALLIDGRPDHPL